LWCSKELHVVGFSTRVDDSCSGYGAWYDQMKKTMRDTNDLGVLGASMVGTQGKGDVGAQIKETKTGLTSMARFLTGTLIDAFLSLGLAGVTSAEGMNKFLKSMSVWFVIGKLPKLLLDARQAATGLLEPLEAIRSEIKLSNDETLKLVDNLQSSMIQMGHSLEDVLEVYTALGRMGELNNQEIRKMANATLLMAEAWGMTNSEIAFFNRTLVTTFGIMAGSLTKIGSAMDHVAKTTNIARQELVQMTTHLKESLLWNIPKALRSKVMPQMIADISAIAGEWEKVFGDPATITEGFNKALNALDEGGLRLRAAIIGFGGATSEELSRILNEKDAGEFWLSQVRAIQKIRDELGDKRFIEIADVYADVFGKSREEILKMAEQDIPTLTKAMEGAQRAMVLDTELKDSWEKARGIFNNIWQTLENVGTAILIGIGKPILKVLVPLLDWFDKMLVSVAEFFKEFSDGQIAIVGIATAFGAVVAIVANVMTVAALPAMAAIFGWIGTVALPFIATGIIAIGAAIGTFLLPFIWPFIAGFAAVALVFTAIKDNWQEFYGIIEPTITMLQGQWVVFKNTIDDVFKLWNAGFGEASEGTLSFMDMFAEVLRAIATIAGWVIKIVGVLLVIIMAVVNAIARIVSGLAGIFGIIGRFGASIFAGIGGDIMNITGQSTETGTEAFQKRMSTGTGLQEGGITTKDIQTVVHKNEAVIPLPQLPELVGKIVHVDQDKVVAEIIKLRESIERLARIGGASDMLAKGVF